MFSIIKYHDSDTYKVVASKKLKRFKKVHIIFHSNDEIVVKDICENLNKGLPCVYLKKEIDFNEVESMYLSR